MTFPGATLSAGFSPAAMPRIEQAIHTDSDWLEAAEVRIPVSDGELPGYRARPRNGDRFPIVLVVQEIFGVHEYIRDVCRRVAKLGYLAIAPELYARQGDVSHITDIQELLTKVVPRVPDAQVMSDLDAAVDLASHDHGDPATLGITGFCWGGRIAWLYAAHNPRLHAAVAWYGRLVSPPDPLHPRHPVDVAAELHCPVLGLYGGKDQAIPRETIDAMRAAAAAAGKPVEIVVYPEAGHAFHSDYRPSYHQASAEDGWRRLTQFFAAHLGA
jgi:carboxymethylenebutenolidase